VVSTHVVHSTKSRDVCLTSTVNGIVMDHLSEHEQIELVRIIKELSGTSLTKHQFTEAAFDLFEDVSGMEGVTTPDAMEIINSMWSIYRG
jgi:hypothetical protein